MNPQPGVVFLSRQEEWASQANLAINESPFYIPKPVCSNLVDISLQEHDSEFAMDRLAMLNDILAQNPNDAFARYGLAMEYSNAGKVELALDEFGKLLAANPDYTAGYFMAAQTLARAERIDEAKQMLTGGIAAAQRTRNTHAQSEMQAMLDEIG
jgi:predicted Zn-dependent protease